MRRPAGLLLRCRKRNRPPWHGLGRAGKLVRTAPSVWGKCAPVDIKPWTAPVFRPLFQRTRKWKPAKFPGRPHQEGQLGRLPQASLERAERDRAVERARFGTAGLPFQPFGPCLLSSNPPGFLASRSHKPPRPNSLCVIWSVRPLPLQTSPGDRCRQLRIYGDI